MATINKQGVPGRFPDDVLAANLSQDAGVFARLAMDQKKSNAPSSLLPLDALLVQAYEGYVEAYNMLSEAARTGDMGRWEQGWVLMTEAGEYRTAAHRLITQLESECGRAHAP